MHTLCSWNEGLTQMMTRKTKVIIQHNDEWLLRRAASIDGNSRANAFHILVMHSKLPEMKDLKQQILRKTEVTIQQNDTPPMRLRRSEYDGEGRNQQAVHSITVCQEQMPRWSIAGITNTEWLVPFQWFNSSFSIWWLANHQCRQKKSVSAAYQPSLDQSTTVRKTDTNVLLLSG